MCERNFRDYFTTICLPGARSGGGDITTSLIIDSDGDTLNYREMLFEKLSSLPAVVSSADAAWSCISSTDHWRWVMSWSLDKFTSCLKLVRPRMRNRSESARRRSPSPRARIAARSAQPLTTTLRTFLKTTI